MARGGGPLATLEFDCATGIWLLQVQWKSDHGYHRTIALYRTVRVPVDFLNFAAEEVQLLRCRETLQGWVDLRMLFCPSKSGFLYTV